MGAGSPLRRRRGGLRGGCGRCRGYRLCPFLDPVDRGLPDLEAMRHDGRTAQVAEFERRVGLVSRVRARLECRVEPKAQAYEHVAGIAGVSARTLRRWDGLLKKHRWAGLMPAWGGGRGKHPALPRPLQKAILDRYCQSPPWSVALIHEHVVKGWCRERVMKGTWLERQVEKIQRDAKEWPTWKKEAAKSDDVRRLETGDKAGLAERIGITDPEQAERGRLKVVELCDVDKQTLTELLGYVAGIDQALQEAAKGFREWRQASERFGLWEEYDRGRREFLQMHINDREVPSDLLSVVLELAFLVSGAAGDLRREIGHRLKDERQARWEAWHSSQKKKS